jgi:hypothetical protein
LGKWAVAKSAGRSGACTRTSTSSAPPDAGTPACSGEKTIVGWVITGFLGWSGPACCGGRGSRQEPAGLFN